MPLLECDIKTNLVSANAGATGWPWGLLLQGSHRSVLAGITAHGSSRYWILLLLRDSIHGVFLKTL